VLVECSTHAIFAANLGPYRASEWEVCQPLLKRLQPGMLCLADRGFNGCEYWRQAQATGAQLLWRCAANRQLPVRQALSDGSYLSALSPTKKGRRAGAAEAIAVRVIEYALPDLPDAQPRYRLLTTLLDPVVAPALELAALYHERWQVEAVFDELKTHLRQSRRVLRSKTAELVRQEFYG
jgi:IS4 transposase